MSEEQAMITRSEQPVQRSDLPETQPIRLSVQDLDALQPRQTEWNALVQRSEINTIFQMYEWHVSWWTAFCGRARPLILVAEVAAEIVGIAPLMLTEKRVLGRKRRVVEFIGVHLSDYCDFIVDKARPGVARLMWQWLAMNDDQWDLLHLSDIPDQSTTLQTLPAFFNRQGYLTDIRVLYEAPTHIFGDPVADQKLVKKNDMRLRYNYYRRNGELEFKNCTTVEDIMVYLELFFRQHTRRRTLTDIPSQFLDERQRIFYTEMVQRLAPSGYLLFSVLLFNQTPIAFHIGFEYDNRLLYYQPTFNVDYVKKSPGIVLLKFLLEYALERNVAEFDFSIGEEPYKYRFANDARVNHEVRVFRRPLPYHLDRVLLDAKGLIKRSPTLSRLGRRFLRQTSKE